MKSIECIKNELYTMEKKQDWAAICNYLLVEWKQQKENPELCTLFVQQSMTYLLASDSGDCALSCCSSNWGNESLRLYLNCFIEAVNYGMTHHLHNKYFLWQVCYYLFHFSTYYPILSVIENDKLETRQNELLALARTQFAESNLFLPWLMGVDYYDWLHNMGSDKLVRVHAEIQEFHLGKNAVDEDVKDLFLLGSDSAVKKGI